MGLAHLVVHASVIQDPFRGCGFARIDVRTNTDISVQIDRGCTSHDSLLSRCLEAVVGECFVSFSHTVHVFTLLDRRTFAFRCIKQFAGKAQIHRLLATLTGSIYQPTHCQGIAAGGTHFNRNLVGGTTYTARFDLDQRSDGIERLFEQLDRIISLGALFNLFQSTVHDALSGGFLAAFHYMVHEFGENLAAILWFWQDLTFCRYTTSWHDKPSNGLQVSSGLQHFRYA